MLNLTDKKKIWELIAKYDNMPKYEKFVTALSNILKGDNIDINLVEITPFMDMNHLGIVDLQDLDIVFSSKLEELMF